MSGYHRQKEAIWRLNPATLESSLSHFTMILQCLSLSLPNKKLQSENIWWLLAVFVPGSLFKLYVIHRCCHTRHTSMFLSYKRHRTQSYYTAPAANHSPIHSYFAWETEMKHIRSQVCLVITPKQTCSKPFRKKKKELYKSNTYHEIRVVSGDEFGRL